MNFEYFLLVLFWAIWCICHSLLIYRPVTQWIESRLPRWFPYYRIGYNLFALLSLMPVWLYGRSVQGPVLMQWRGVWIGFQFLLLGAALFFFIGGAQRYDVRQFLGLRQARAENSCSVLTDDCTLDTGGILSVVRHPWYSGGICLIWARHLDTATLLTNLVLTTYFIVGAVLEERKLTTQFGLEYQDYCRRVSMLAPLKWIERKLGS